MSYESWSAASHVPSDSAVLAAARVGEGEAELAARPVPRSSTSPPVVLVG